MPDPYDLIVIGAGPGGYVAAIRAAQLGLKTAVVEREHLGGICLNWGCIPTKALLRSADVYRLALHGADFGLDIAAPKFDIAKIVARSREIAGKLNAGVEFLFKKNKIDVIFGQARIAAAGVVEVGPSRKPAEAPQAPIPKSALGPGVYNAKNIIVATGARPRALPGLEPDGRLIWTYFDALKPAALPKSLLVVGAGAIGVEFASFYSTFGVSVTLVEALPRILPAEDAEIAALATRSFKKQGIEILVGTKVSAVEKHENGVIATLTGAGGATRRVEAERLLSAAGVVANVEGLGLEALGVGLERGVIATDGLGRTNVAGILAIGDVAGGPMLAHKAEHEGIACVDALARINAHPLDKTRIPACTYAHPQVGSG